MRAIGAPDVLAKFLSRLRGYATPKFTNGLAAVVDDLELQLALAFVVKWARDMSQCENLDEIGICCIDHISPPALHSARRVQIRRGPLEVRGRCRDPR